MARLSAHGHEMLRVSRTLGRLSRVGKHLDPPTPRVERLLERSTVSYRSDGSTLSKIDTEWLDARYPHKHCYGWKLHQSKRKGWLSRKPKDYTTPEWVRFIAERAIARGYTIENIDRSHLNKG